ncbi:TPA: hypothetical protein ACNR7P_001086, partial [Escherichia coli]
QNNYITVTVSVADSHQTPGVSCQVQLPAMARLDATSAYNESPAPDALLSQCQLLLAEFTNHHTVHHYRVNSH